MEAQPKVSGNLDDRNITETKHLEDLKTPQISLEIKITQKDFSADPLMN